MQRVPMTPEGLEKLRAKLKHLKEVEHPKVVREIETARAHGDLSENAEYHAAKEKQGLIMATIRDLESKISRAEVIDPRKLSGTRVVFGATVELYDVDRDVDITYRIVGDDEADVREGRIGISSPIARALIGKEEGDEVKVRTPGGVRCLEVVAVRFE